MCRLAALRMTALGKYAARFVRHSWNNPAGGDDLLVPPNSLPESSERLQIPQFLNPSILIP